MKTIQNLSLILILFQIIPITGAINCTCQYLHPQARYCLTETVLLGYYERSINHNTHLFHVVIVLKTDQPIDERVKITVYTPTGCGFPYNTTSDLIILFGNFDDRGLSSKVCAKGQEWEKLTDIQRRGFSHGYKKGCSCLINVHDDKRFKNVCLGQKAYLTFDGKNCKWEHKDNDNCGHADIFWPNLKLD